MYPKHWHIFGGPMVKTTDDIVRKSSYLQDMIDFKKEQIKRAKARLRTVKTKLRTWRPPKDGGKDDRAGDALNERIMERDDLSAKLLKYGEDEKILKAELRRAKRLEYDAKRKGTTYKPAIPEPQRPTIPKIEVSEPKGMVPMSLAGYNRKMALKKERAVANATKDEAASRSSNQPAQTQANASAPPIFEASTSNGQTTAGSLKRKARTDQDLDVPPSRKQKRGDDGSVLRK